MDVYGYSHISHMLLYVVSYPQGVECCLVMGNKKKSHLYFLRGGGVDKKIDCSMLLSFIVILMISVPFFKNDFNIFFL